MCIYIAMQSHKLQRVHRTPKNAKLKITQDPQSCKATSYTGTPKFKVTPPEKLLGDGFSTPMPLFCLIYTIISNKTCILDEYQKTNFK